MVNVVRPSPFATQRLPPPSNARNCGALRDIATLESFTVGAGSPVPTSWAGVYSTTVFGVEFETQRSPLASKARPIGRVSALPGALMTTGGVGLPLVASCAAPNSATVLFPALATHRLPLPSNASPSGDEIELPERVTAGAGEPLVPNWLAEYSTIEPLLATQRLPAGSKATPMLLPAEPLLIVTAGDTVPLASWAEVNSTTVGGAMAFAIQRLPAADIGEALRGEVVPLELHPIASAPARQMSNPEERLGMGKLERSMVMLLVEIE